MLLSQCSSLSQRQVAPCRGVSLPLRTPRCVRAQLFRGPGPSLADESVDEFNAPTKRQRDQIKRTLAELGFTEQAADILAYGKITNSNADLLIGDIRASFGIYQQPTPQGPVETVQNGVQDLLARLRLPFLGLVLAAGLVALASANRELLASLLPEEVVSAVAESAAVVMEDAVDFLDAVPGLGRAADAIDDFLFVNMQR
ncbi:hypothetical protein TSOC_012602 [Tetrabaena socialis]|uniref:Uncharacterized protein n=1 Tax=Tetrabaena socialis TaxID=47790 RepID=A0A2J7ZML2_9CHLO|nr:hypothetical protein TSOC_012602 [Tetrabaena socialis]|eukprot:PNH01506.1 hypothetical protein TSOC_012602 [Tetrabaena socialis]